MFTKTVNQHHATIQRHTNGEGSVQK